jgi:hypothetical protein
MSDTYRIAPRGAARADIPTCPLDRLWRIEADRLDRIGKCVSDPSDVKIVS